MIDLRKLRMLSELERLGTIAAVAEQLRLTAPGISMQLAALERELGVALTERQGRRLALTPAGRLLAAHGRELVDRLSVAELEVDAIRRGDAGHYRIAAFPSAARTFVADAWRASLHSDSGTVLSLTTPEPEGALADLQGGRTDLAIVHEYSNVPRARIAGIDREPVVSEPIWLAISESDTAVAAEVDLGELAGHRWIAPTRGVTCFEMTERACGLAGFRPQIVAESMDFAAQLELVAAGVGVALVPHLTIANVPPGVVIARTRTPLRRFISAARRTSMGIDSGLDRIVALLTAAAGARVRTEPPVPAPTPPERTRPPTPSSPVTVSPPSAPRRSAKAPASTTGRSSTTHPSSSPSATTPSAATASLLPVARPKAPASTPPAARAAPSRAPTPPLRITRQTKSTSTKPCGRQYKCPASETGSLVAPSNCCTTLSFQ